MLIFILPACTVNENRNQKPFPVLATSADDEWATYEGKWLKQGGIIRFELSLKSGSLGYDSYYKLTEYFESDRSASGTPSHGLYSTYNRFANKELGICLHDVGTYENGNYLRFKKNNDIDGQDEMYFVTRGNDELLPCNNTFTPLTTDKRYTLHKRSNLFTVEGYFTMAEDSIEFFERNTREYWKITDLGEFNELTLAYHKLVKEKYEGIYLKALAYTVLDTTSKSGKGALVIKRIKSLGNDPTN